MTDLDRLYALWRREAERAVRDREAVHAERLREARARGRLVGFTLAVWLGVADRLEPPRRPSR